MHKVKLQNTRPHHPACGFAERGTSCTASGCRLQMCVVHCLRPAPLCPTLPAALLSRTPLLHRTACGGPWYMDRKWDGTLQDQPSQHATIRASQGAAQTQGNTPRRQCSTLALRIPPKSACQAAKTNQTQAKNKHSSRLTSLNNWCNNPTTSCIPVAATATQQPRHDVTLCCTAETNQVNQVLHCRHLVKQLHQKQSKS